MKRIGLISDTHSHLDPKVFKYFKDCDEIWHAGDIGNLKVADDLEAFKPFRAVYGNIDGADLRVRYPLNLHFELEGVRVFITHIGGYPGRYSKRIIPILEEKLPDLFITGHSHILKVMRDKKRDIIHMNPGAAGVHGFHQVKTLLRFTIDQGLVKDLEVIELGLRGKIK